MEVGDFYTFSFFTQRQWNYTCCVSNFFEAFTLAYFHMVCATTNKVTFFWLEINVVGFFCTEQCWRLSKKNFRKQGAGFYFTLVFFFFQRKVSFFLHNGQKWRSCYCDIIRYVRLLRRMLSQATLESLSRECLPEWIMKHPAWCNILVHVHTREINI